MPPEGHDVVRLDVGEGLFVQVPTGEAPAERDAARPSVPWPAVAIGFALSIYAIARLGATHRGILAAGLLPVLAALAGVDLRTRLLPNRLVLPALGVVLTYQIISFPDRTPEWLLGALGGAAVILLPGLLRPGAMGMGDVKLAALLGAALGAQVLPALLIGFVAVLPAAVAVLLRQGAAGRAATLPLGPFLALGGAAMLLA
jgi:leader peptidase (prepilin peptidase)/N-methyltransferase